MAAGNELHNQLDRYRALLAVAEAREATEVIPGTREALAGLSIRRGKPNPCTCLGAEPCTCHGLSAAQVVEACRVALGCWAAHVSMPTGPTANYGAILESFAVAKMETDAALALCARWKEANGDR